MPKDVLTKDEKAQWKAHRKICRESYQTFIAPHVSETAPECVVRATLRGLMRTLDEKYPNRSDKWPLVLGKIVPKPEDLMSRDQRGPADPKASVVKFYTNELAKATEKGDKKAIAQIKTHLEFVRNL